MDCVEDHTKSVQALVIVAFVAMLLLHLLGSLRRQSSNGFLHEVVKGVDTLSYPLVSFTIGRMNKSDWYNNDFVVWAVILLLLLGSTDSLTACRLAEIDGWKSIHVKHLFQGFMVVYIILDIFLFGQGKNITYLQWPLAAVVFVGVLKAYVRITSMRMASKPYLCRSMTVIDEYMKHEDNPLAPFDPVTMQGYRYIVAGEQYYHPKKHLPSKKYACFVTDMWARVWCACRKTQQYTTVEQIWQCTGNLLRHEQGQVLKDLCLSMALSKMLNQRFAGINISEARLEKTHEFVFKGLLAGDKPHHRAFRVIEKELVFVHDMYYTRYSYLYQKGRYFALCLPIIMFSLCSWLIFLLVQHNKGTNDSFSDITIVITIVLACLEAYQLYLYLASGWFKVTLIRSYLSLQRFGCFLEMIIGLLLRLKAFRPWKKTLGQYCFLEELGRKDRLKSCLHYPTLRLVDKSMKKGKSSIKLSNNVKKAIVDSLLGSNPFLTSGATSLQKNGVHSHLSWACDDSIGTEGMVTRTILVWHIATTLCQHQDAQAKVNEDTITIASNLSEYCMYLLAFAPKLLPDHSSISGSILDETIEGACNILQKIKNDKLKRKCKELMKNTTHDRYNDGDEASLIVKGVQLARCLMEDIQDSKLRWKVLSEFWAEMMLYVSPSNNVSEHLEALARGGEFITHIWALLTHAGVLNRDSTGSKDIV